MPVRQQYPAPPAAPDPIDISLGAAQTLMPNFFSSSGSSCETDFAQEYIIPEHTLTLARLGER